MIRIPSENPGQPAVIESEKRRQQFKEIGWWVSIPINTISSKWLYQTEQRLDGSYYSAETNLALRALEQSTFETARLGSLVEELFILGRFKRIYSDDSSQGWPYLSASETLDFRPESNRFIAKEHAPRDPERHFAKSGWLLISSSGTVGRPILVTERLEQFFLTHDLIRVIPGDATPAGYLYAFILTWIGQALIVKDQYGSAINHLEPHHLAEIPVPLIPTDKQYEIASLIEEAYKLRLEANRLLDEADKILHQGLGLPAFNKGSVPYLYYPGKIVHSFDRPEMPHPKAFTVNRSELADRLDSSYHAPTVKTVIDLIGKAKYPAVRLGEIAKIHLPARFKRIYVGKDMGVPFLKPSHLPQLRPYGMEHIAKHTDILDSLLLHPGEVLVTTDGTVGRIGLVGNTIAGWAGSNNLARITCVDKEMNGYLAAFLASPYGYYQITREIYGGVVDHIDASHIESVLVPICPPDLQLGLGDLVVRAYEYKDQAMKIEDDAVEKLESFLLPAAPRSAAPPSRSAAGCRSCSGSC